MKWFSRPRGGGDVDSGSDEETLKKKQVADRQKKKAKKTRTIWYRNAAIMKNAEQRHKTPNAGNNGDTRLERQKEKRKQRSRQASEATHAQKKRPDNWAKVSGQCHRSVHSV
jgi:hypothetical protein